MEKAKIGDIIECIQPGGHMHGIKYRVVERPSDVCVGDPGYHDIWVKTFNRDDSKPGYLHDVEYKIISHSGEAQTDPDFDQRMKQKVDNNLRDLFT